MVASLPLSAADDAAPKKKREIPAEVLKKYDKDGDGIFERRVEFDELGEPIAARK